MGVINMEQYIPKVIVYGLAAVLFAGCGAPTANIRRRPLSPKFGQNIEERIDLVNNQQPTGDSVNQLYIAQVRDLLDRTISVGGRSIKYYMQP